MENFIVTYDDMYCMSMWCELCKADVLAGVPDNRYGREWPLLEFTELAQKHLQSAHPG